MTPELAQQISKSQEPRLRAVAFIMKFRQNFDSTPYIGDSPQAKEEREQFRQEATEIYSLLKTEKQLKAFQKAVEDIWVQFKTKETIYWAPGLYDEE